MARIIFGSLVTSINGKVGGSVIQRNGYGFTIKNKSHNVRPNKPLQQLSKEKLTFAAQKWRSISGANRTAWNTYAATFPVPTNKNPDAYISGYSAFLRWHGIHQYVNNNTLANPSGPQGSTFIGIPEIARVGAALHIVLDFTYTQGPWTAVAFLSFRKKETQVFSAALTRYIGNLTAASGYDENEAAGYIQAFGQLPEIGDNIAYWIGVINESNGQVKWGAPGSLLVT